MAKHHAPKGPSQRQLRVGEMLRHALADLLLRSEVADPELEKQSITVTEVRGCGRQRGHTELYRGSEYAVDFPPKFRLEIAVGNDLVDAVIEAIAGAARTGDIGDGKVFAFALD